MRRMRRIGRIFMAIGGLGLVFALLFYLAGMAHGQGVWLPSDTSGINADVTALKGATQSLNAAVVSLNQATQTLNVATQSLQSQVGNLQGATQSLNTSVGNLNLATQAHETAIGNLNTATQTLNAATQSLQTQVGNLNLATQAHDAAIGNLNLATQTLNTATQSLQSQVVSLQGATQSLDVSVGNLNLATQAHETAIGNLNLATQTLNTATQSLQSQIGVVSQMVASAGATNLFVLQDGRKSTGNVTFASGTTVDVKNSSMFIGEPTVPSNPASMYYVDNKIVSNVVMRSTVTDPVFDPWAFRNVKRPMKVYANTGTFQKVTYVFCNGTPQGLLAIHPVGDASTNFGTPIFYYTGSTTPQTGTVFLVGGWTNDIEIDNIITNESTATCGVVTVQSSIY